VFLNGEGSGKFLIRATVRDKSNVFKLKPLLDYFGEKFGEMVELFDADLMDEDSIDRAVNGCDFIVHSASPTG
jgi:hypothetical protein